MDLSAINTKEVAKAINKMPKVFAEGSFARALGVSHQTAAEILERARGGTWNQRLTKRSQEYFGMWEKIPVW